MKKTSHRSGVCLVDMPWSSLRSPSIQIGILKALLVDSGIKCSDFYLNSRWHKFCLSSVPGYSANLYREISESRSGIGEMIFSGFNEQIIDIPTWFSEKPSRIRGISSRAVSMAQALRDVVHSFVASEARRLINSGFRVFGFTTTFAQTIPVLALSHELKRVCDGVKIVVGGANCTGEMGEALGELYPWIDVIFQGEAEGRVQHVFERLLSCEPLEGIQGIIAPRSGYRSAESAPAMPLDSHPVPDFHGFFEEIDGVEQADGDVLQLVYETSRGCWWGERKHCSFCGLNADSMAFRSKAPKKVADELESLSSQYKIRNFQIVDNIFDKRYFDELLPSLAVKTYEIFWEVKASMRKSEVKALAAAGINRVQPGIESFHPVTLRNMAKGVSPAINIRFLRWCELYGISPTWLIMYNLPGDRARFYSEQALLVQKIYHLEPPAVVRLELQRFSPYWKHPDRYNVEIGAAYEAYSVVHNGTPEQIGRLAYEFEYSHPEDAELDLGINVLKEAVADWQRAREGWRPVLNGVLLPSGEMLVTDTRSGQQRELLLSREEADFINRCDAGLPLSRIASNVELMDLASKLVQHALIVEIDETFVSLPLFEI
jgi:ribosomal peptide maturation radical SAM protein 1